MIGLPRSQQLSTDTPCVGSLPESPSGAFGLPEQQTPSTTGAKRGPRPKPGKVTSQNLMAMLAAQGFRCALSGVELTPATVGLDHKVPVKQGGDDSLGNVQLVHRKINGMKQAQSDDEFIEWCRKVVEYADRQGK